ncbi:hypothetical protein P8631_11885 [Guyparkeria sp. 1SP6A2]|nr:hypothetical protein [Guyparkeria sp. 1SP6A2]
MKMTAQLLAATILAMAPFHAMAEEKSPEEICNSYAVVAEDVMKGRLAGRSLRGVMSRLGDKPVTNENRHTMKIIKRIVTYAYQWPLPSIADHREIIKFSNDVYLVCYENVTK